MSTTVELGRMRDQRDAALVELAALRAGVRAILADYAPIAKSQRGCNEVCGCTDCDMADDLRILLGADS